MRIAALGDINSNHIALEACMDWIHTNRIDGIAFLGDYVSGCPYPQKTMHIIRNIPQNYMTWFVRGNREDYMLHHTHRLNKEWSYCSQSGSLLYTYENLSAEDLRFFESMPIGIEIKLDGYEPFSICHGSMQDNNFQFCGDSPETRKAMSQSATRLTVCGHCHIPYEYSISGKTIVNAGSVGNPQDQQLAATLILLTAGEGENWQHELIHVPFDIERAVAEFYESGLIDKANVWSRAYIAAMREGSNYNFECVKLVSKMCGERNLPFDCEELWQEAAEQLGI